MTNDDARKPADAPWRQIGPGLFIASRCWRCNQSKPRLGGKMLWPGRLFHCAQCVKVRA